MPSYLIHWLIILPNPAAVTVDLFTAEPESLIPWKKKGKKVFLWNDFGSISEQNNNFMAGQPQSNYIWPQAETSISTQETS